VAPCRERKQVHLLGRRGVFGGEVGDDLCRVDADADDLADESDDVLGVVGVVGVAGDAAAFVGLDAVLVDDAGPFNRGSASY